MKVVFGIPTEPMPIAGIPDGKYRVRMNNKSVARIFVKTAGGIRKFFLEDGGKIWFAHEEGRSEKQIQRTGWFRGANVIKCGLLNRGLLTT